jgi:hypothetical protein
MNLRDGEGYSASSTRVCHLKAPEVGSATLAVKVIVCQEILLRAIQVLPVDLDSRAKIESTHFKLRCTLIGS